MIERRRGARAVDAEQQTEPVDKLLLAAFARHKVPQRERAVGLKLRLPVDVAVQRRFTHVALVELDELLHNELAGALLVEHEQNAEMRQFERRFARPSGRAGGRSFFFVGIVFVVFFFVVLGLSLFD